MSALEKIFKLKQNGTTVRTEIVAGLTTFMTMAYIIALNRIRQANASSVVLEAPVTTLPVGESYRPAFRKFLAEK